MPQIDVVAAKTAFGENGGDVCGQRTRAFGRGIDHHARKPRWQRERAQFPALVGDAAVRVDSAKLNEECPRFAERGLRWRIEKGEF